MSANEKDDSLFVNFSEYKSAADRVLRPRGNVIKGESIHIHGERRIRVEESESDAPKVVVHKEGDRVDSVEFICPCGKSTSLRFDYDQDLPPSA